MSLQLDDLHGRINDVDSHWEIPASQWGSVFGDRWGRLAQPFLGTVRYDRTDDAGSGAEAFWTTKATNAPGVASCDGRLRALDAVGIDRQLIFPQLVTFFRPYQPNDEGRALLREYNDTVVEWTRASGGRLRPAALVPQDDVSAAIAEVERVVDAGARAVYLPDGAPLAGLCPACEQLDPLWATLDAAGVAATIHIGGSQGFAANVWEQAPGLRHDPPGTAGLDDLPAPAIDADEMLSPHLLGTMHLSPSNYLTTLVFGGVFDRHPGLRFGIIEYGALWFAPLIELLDHRQTMSRRLRRLQRRPSEVARDNVRVTPFFVEPIARQIERHGLAEVYCFSTDFPHPEGGTSPHTTVLADIAPLGDDAITNVFVTNAELLLPR